MMIPDTLPYVPLSSTSKEAAGSMKPRAAALRQLVLDTIRSHRDGLTCDEVEALTGLRHQTASARICELRDVNVIVATGDKRPTRSGRNAAVYRVSTTAQAGR
ncbi:hypothetical protein [uncultured Methylobacterium sp.]|jgi:Fic family protein|uniref:hypothetical protein n=1 Tax=uncultured Methylobacterium sp. TaxID=157278 RepID=UPI002605D0AD|nr:hypothetical protein [uncultured Methylobacterium sp.]